MNRSLFGLGACGLLAALLALSTACNTTMETVSPNGQNRIAFSLDDAGRLHYTVVCDGTTLVERSEAGIATSVSGDFTEGLRRRATSRSYIDETYTLPTGKVSTYTNRANETSICFANAAGEELTLVARAYDDGVAFRYVVERPGAIEVTNEITAITLPAGAVTWAMDWTPHNEGEYPRRTIAELETAGLAYPVLVETRGRWMLLSEADVYDIPATHLEADPAASTLRIAYAPEDPSFTVEDRFSSSWRAFMVGSELGTIVQSTLLENLNPPSLIEDQSWIEPGVATFPWWDNHLANSHIDTLKAYVDLAAEMDWEWIEFDVALVGSPFRASRQWETTEWLPELVGYARSRGIRVYGWDDIATLCGEAGRSHIFGSYRELGIDGIKIDYVESESQAMMRARDTALRVAADYGLMVSFHGELTPRGQRRSYPHTMTLEGVRGAEYYTFRNDKPLSAEHNCTLPFTRNVVGPMDYTPTTFTIRPENPRVTTYAHELALPFVFESGWVCMADRPDVYLSSPARPILKRIEASWDETRLLDGYPGEYVCMARRKGDSWYIGALNAATPRTIEVALDFLAPGEYVFDVYEDKAGREMHEINVRTERKRAGERLTISMPRHGGYCTVIDPQ